MLSNGDVRVVAAVHPRLLGIATLAHLAIRVTGPLDPVVDTITAIESVVLVSETTGTHHLVVEIRVPSTADLADAIARVRACAGVVDIAVLVYDRVVRSLFLREAPTADLALDKVDIAIMSQLQRDGRTGFAELAGRVGLSPSAARTRVLRLLQANVMQIGAIRRRAAGDTPDVLFGVGIADAAHPQRVIERLLELPGLEFVASTVGRYAIVATVGVPSMSGLAEIVAMLRDEAGMGVVDTWIHSTVRVERYDRPLERLLENVGEG